MTMTKIILAAAGVLVATAVMADPSVELRGSSAKNGGKGDIDVVLHPNGATITAITVQIPTSSGVTFSAPGDVVSKDTTRWSDTTKVDAGASANAFVILYEYPGGTAGATADEVVCTIKGSVTGSGISSKSVVADAYDPGSGLGSYLTDDGFNSLAYSASTSFVLGGPGRNIGTAASASLTGLAAGKDATGSYIAATAGGKLYVMKSADLTDQVTAVALGGTKGGKPSFGTAGGSLVVAAGDDAGNVKVVKVADGSTVSSFSAGGAVNNAPAITSTGDIFVAVGGGLVHKGASGNPDATVGGGGIALSSPAVVNGHAILGTDGGVKTFSVDSSTGTVTPLVGTVSGNFTTSPAVVDGGAAALIADATGNVTKVNLATGAAIGGPLALGTAVSSGFRSSTGLTAFGGADGKVYFVTDGNTLSSSTSFSTAALNSAVTIGGSTYVADANGKFGRVGAGTDSVTTSGAVGSSTVATGTTSGTDVVAVGTNAGSIVSIPVF